jgi:hypothetical protein
MTNHPSDKSKYPKGDTAVLTLTVVLILVLIGGVAGKNACKAGWINWDICKSLTQPGFKLWPYLRM